MRHCRVLPVLFVFALVTALPEQAQADLTDTSYGGRTISRDDLATNGRAEVCLQFPEGGFLFPVAGPMSGFGAAGDDRFEIDLGFIAFWGGGDASGIAIPGRIIDFHDRGGDAQGITR